MDKQLNTQISPLEVTDKVKSDKITISDEDIINHLSDIRKKAKNYQDQRQTKRETWYKEYRAQPYGNERENYSKTVQSVIWNTVQGTAPGLLEIFTGDFFTLKATQDDNADKLQQLIKYQMLVKNEGENELDDWIQNCLIYEFGILKVFYKNEYETITETIKEEIDEQTFLALQQDYTITKYTPVVYDLGDGTTVTTYKDIKLTKEEIVYAGPVMKNIAPWEFYISPGCKSVDEAKYVGHWVKKTLDEIKRLESAKIYRKGSLDKIKEKIGSGDSETNSMSEESSQYDLDDSIGMNYDSTDDYSSRKETLPASEVWVKEEYIKIDLDGDGLLENAIVVTCEDVVLSIAENPYKRPPFRLGRIYPEPHKITGIPFTELLSYEQKTQTNLVRFLQDGAAMSTWKNPITNDPQMRRALDQRKPFETIMGDPNKVGYLEVPPPSQAIFNTLEFAQGAVENKTGVTRYNQGLDADSMNKTATGIGIIASAGQQKQKLIAKRLGRTLEKVIRDFIFINQTWPPTNVIDIVGTNLQIDPNDLRGEYHVNIQIGIGPQEKQFTAAQIDNFLQAAIGPLSQMGLTDPLKIREAFEFKGKLQEIPYERFMFSEQEFQEKQGQGLQAMQQQLQQAGQQIQGMDQQLQQLAQENESLKQKITPEYELQMKQAETQGKFELEKYKAELAAQVEMKKIEMQLLQERELTLIKLEADKEVKLMIAKLQYEMKQAENTQVVAIEQI